MTTQRPHLSTADARRETVVASAITVFARSGYASTPIAAVAEHAKISPAYVFKLFPAKVALFVAALDRCYQQIIDALEDGATKTDGQAPADVLDAMGASYAALIADRDLMMLQVHAQAATDVPEIAEAVRRGIARVTSFAQSRSGGSPAEVQRFMAFGQLCHLLTTLDLFGVDEPWAHSLTEGIRHHAEQGGETP
ncbi:TetR/AcrR family transcriptional regulator [Phytoactinopolyspora halotolerans]|uniref:TetR/AcrR family transcriptional regulator n=1 Tax=Phytoactinopolyspora halotolerans TaxID=1981512 RepID=A0A6L9SH76_9ACTN|nr:TetR/AcrR family transcriptional regulator [Phytoactinopolyspora halotolerans]NEE04004.1 TetR/AcrR family transcriptional regulator [Phytoactinopolyspora halotolerans]